MNLVRFQVTEAQAWLVVLVGLLFLIGLALIVLAGFKLWRTRDIDGTDMDE